MEFGEKLQNLRKASNLNQEQLADMLNVSRQSVSKWESGATYPEMDKLIAMAKIFNCSIDDLVNNEVKGKEITTNKNKQVGQYADNLLNFIVDTVNMFFSMKFTTLVKTLCELFIIGFILFGGGILLIAVTYEFLDNSLY
ncbi:MAG: helix-turn-helix domain-containing protein, partial [Bacilli bacterium]|nr:helix-turn-helix domain-containing protein [Bacilli bacterium]